MDITEPPTSGGAAEYRDLLQRELRHLRCPSCHDVSLSLQTDGIECAGCGALYSVDPEARLGSVMPSESSADTKSDIQAFWSDLYQQLYGAADAAMTPDKLEESIDQLEDLFVIREQSCVVEMPYKDLAGKRVLEIGSGAGGHSCIFKRYGAHVTAVDITPQRAASTAAKFAMLKGGSGIAFHADAENLPFQDASFDIVYSNGVLHHSPDTERCIAEATRVLKPGGLAVIMLYSRVSAAFMFNIWPRGVITGEMFRWPEAEWVGRLTEGKPEYGTTRNPITRVYSAKQMRALFRGYDIVSLRKWSFQFDNFCVPRLTQIRRWVLSRLGFKPHPGGTIVYGQPIVPETAIERRLGAWLGFGWTIKAIKPGEEPKNG